MCGGRSSILHYGPLIETNNLYAPTPNGQSLIALLNKSNTPHSKRCSLLKTLNTVHKLLTVICSKSILLHDADQNNHKNSQVWYIKKPFVRHHTNNVHITQTLVLSVTTVGLAI